MWPLVPRCHLCVLWSLEAAWAGGTVIYGDGQVGTWHHHLAPPFGRRGIPTSVWLQTSVLFWNALDAKHISNFLVKFSLEVQHILKFSYWIFFLEYLFIFEICNFFTFFQPWNCFLCFLYVDNFLLSARLLVNFHPHTLYYVFDILIFCVVNIFIHRGP